MGLGDGGLRSGGLRLPSEVGLTQRILEDFEGSTSFNGQWTTTNYSGGSWNLTTNQSYEDAQSILLPSGGTNYVVYSNSISQPPAAGSDKKRIEFWAYVTDTNAIFNLFFRFQDDQNWYSVPMYRIHGGGQSEAVGLSKYVGGSYTQAIDTDTDSDPAYLQTGNWHQYRVDFWEEDGVVKAQVYFYNGNNSQFEPYHPNVLQDPTPSLNGSGGIGFGAGHWVNGFDDGANTYIYVDNAAVIY